MILDTNALSALLDKDVALLEAIRQSRELALPVIVFDFSHDVLRRNTPTARQVGPLKATNSSVGPKLAFSVYLRAGQSLAAAVRYMTLRLVAPRRRSSLPDPQRQDRP